MSISISFNEKSGYSNISNPEPEPEFIGREGKENFRKSIIWIIIDLVVTQFLIFVQYGLFKGKIETINIIIVSSIALVFFVCILIFVISHVTILVLISKYCYITIGGIYYAYKLLLMIIFLIDNESGISNFDLVIFVVVLATIIPRIIVFYNIELLVKVCKKVDESKRVLAHDKFIEKIGDKVDRGSRWSNTLEIERVSSAQLNEQKDKKK